MKNLLRILKEHGIQVFHWDAKSITVLERYVRHGMLCADVVKVKPTKNAVLRFLGY